MAHLLNAHTYASCCCTVLCLRSAYLLINELVIECDNQIFFLVLNYRVQYSVAFWAQDYCMGFRLTVRTVVAAL